MNGIYTLAGCVCVALGFLGIWLPLLPTTPFLLLAAFCFSRGSQRLHRWLLAHRTFGPIIHDWQAHRVIRPKTKKIAALMMLLLMGPAIAFGPYPPELKVASALIGSTVLLLLFSHSKASTS